MTRKLYLDASAVLATGNMSASEQRLQSIGQSMRVFKMLWLGVLLAFSVFAKSDANEHPTLKLRILPRDSHHHHAASFQQPNQTRLDFFRAAARADALRFQARRRAGLLQTNSLGDVAPVSPSLQVAKSVLFSGASVGTGQYFVEIKIGTPPKQFLLIPDTGSDLIWVHCNLNSPARRRRPRQHAHHHHHHHSSPHRRHRRSQKSDRLFHARSSSTFRTIPCTAKQCYEVPAPAEAACEPRHPTACEYEYRYSDDSNTTGIFAYDTVSLKPTSLPNVAFGCSTSAGGDSFAGADGVLGLGQGPISFTTQVGRRFSYTVSYCLVDHLQDPSTFSYLVFGRRAEVATSAPIQSTPLVDNAFASDTYYYVSVVSLSVDNDILDIPPSAWAIDRHGVGGTIVDSGTTLSYLVGSAYDVVLDRMKDIVLRQRRLSELVTEPFDLCVDSSKMVNPSKSLPSLSMQLARGALFRPPVNNVWIEAAQGVRCLGFLRADASDSNVIGNVMQQNFFFEFDRVHEVIRFAAADCSKH